MSQPAQVPDLDPRHGPRGSPARPPGDRPLLYPEGLPLVSLFVAGAVSFVFLVLGPLFTAPFLFGLMDDGESGGPLLLPIYTHNPLLEALVGTLVLTILSLVVASAHRLRPFPRWLPLALSFPVAWALVLPSMLEHGGWWVAWLAFGSILAGAFCLHWAAFQWAREAWD
jgi:hypothetical protein